MIERTTKYSNLCATSFILQTGQNIPTYITLSTKLHCEIGIKAQDKSARLIFFLNFSTKTHVVCTQKNGLNETVLLGTQNTFKVMDK